MATHTPLSILALEPYAALSHQRFLEGLAEHSTHRLEIQSLPARRWKWRMRTAALHWAHALAEHPGWDLLLVSDYLNLAELEALLPARLRGRPALVYFHENQLTYPLQAGERRDVHHGLTHLYAALVARAVVFNSAYHERAFHAALAELCALVPDVALDTQLAEVRARSHVLPLGSEAPCSAPRPATSGAPLIVWPHRWEYDKAPELCASTLLELWDAGHEFRLRLLGQRFRREPDALAELRTRAGERLEPGGFEAEHDAYLATLRRSDLVLSTARHEFFGLATLEALRSGCLPVLPDALAYPELLPSELDERARFLYADTDALAPTLLAALEAARTGDWMDDRGRLVEHAANFAWSKLAPRYDALFEELCQD